MLIIIYVNNFAENKCMQIAHVINKPPLFRPIIPMVAVTDKTNRLPHVFLEDLLAEFVTSHERSIRMHSRRLVSSYVKCSFKNKINQSGLNSVQHGAQ
jgi:hypothetical protein